MKFTFSVDKIIEQFFEPFENADGPPIMFDADEVDFANDDGGEIHLMRSADGQIFLASQRDYNGNGLPVVHSREAAATTSSVFDAKGSVTLKSFPFPTIKALVKSALEAGNDHIAIEWAGQGTR
jgi:hypothetical protein